MENRPPICTAIWCFLWTATMACRAAGVQSSAAQSIYSEGDGNSQKTLNRGPDPWLAQLVTFNPHQVFHSTLGKHKVCESAHGGCAYAYRRGINFGPHRGLAAIATYSLQAADLNSSMLDAWTIRNLRLSCSVIRSLKESALDTFR